MEVYTEQRPWGSFEKFNENERCTVKLLYIKPGSRLSLQYHTKRKEFWKIVKGAATVEVQNKQSSLSEGDNIIIPSGAKHRIQASNSGCIVLEIAYGNFDENDIVRIEDDYDRA
ncbi:MAG TPA: phosphomannose isomerase type II C-terminal cupin domain [Nitrososphaeraceae archaeon]